MDRAWSLLTMRRELPFIVKHADVSTVDNADLIRNAGASIKAVANDTSIKAVPPVGATDLAIQATKAAGSDVSVTVVSTIGNSKTT